MPSPRIRVALLLRKSFPEGDRVLLLQQQKNNRTYWLLPGGGLNYGETLTEAIERELAEELGLRLKTLGRLLWCNDSIAPDGSRHLVSLYFEGTATGEARLAEEESITAFGFFSAKEVANMEIHPPLSDQLIRYLEAGETGDTYLGALWKK